MMGAVEDDGGQRTHDAAADGVEHLQRAAREMIAAARSFLDAVEQVVEDNEALRDASASVTDLVATVVDSVRSGARSAPWETTDPGRSVRPDETDFEETDSDETDSDETEAWAQPLVDEVTPRRPSRVRRIAVD